MRGSPTSPTLPSKVSNSAVQLLNVFICSQGSSSLTIHEVSRYPLHPASIFAVSIHCSARADTARRNSDSFCAGAARALQPQASRQKRHRRGAGPRKTTPSRSTEPGKGNPAWPRREMDARNEVRNEVCWAGHAGQGDRSVSRSEGNAGQPIART